MIHRIFPASLVPLVLLFTAPVFGKTASELCHGTAAKADDGNWYCSEVTTITYRNISQAGDYNVTTGVDPDRGLCSHEKVSYSGRGPKTPLFGQVSMHLRGPMNISQIAVYHLSSPISKRDSQDPNNQGHTYPGSFDTAVEEYKKKFEQPRAQDSEASAQGSNDTHLTRRTFPTNSHPPLVDGNAPSSPSPQFCTTTCVKTVTTTVFVTAAHCGLCHLDGVQAPKSKGCPCATSEASVVVLSSVDAIDGLNTLYQQPAVPTKFITLPALPQTSLPPISEVTIPVVPLPLIMGLPVSVPGLSPIQLPSIPQVEPPKLPLPALPYISLSMGAEISWGKREEPTLEGEPASAIEPTSTPKSTVKTEQEVVAAAAAWKRVAYYTSTAPAEATGFAFLANLGDDRKSGTFDYSFGNSLGFVTKDGRQIASEATPFDGVLETSEAEIVAFTDKSCDEGCDYWRPKSVANYGWEGEDKAFFIQFQMDHYDNVGNDQGLLSDAPAWWFLNAAIPRILQYGNDRNNIPCSCWITGCGEFDAFEVLGRGEERAKSTIHRQGNVEGGDSNYFRRPVGRMLKFAVVFHNFNITAAALPDGFDFSPTLSEQIIANILAYDPNSSSHSLFAIGD